MVSILSAVEMNNVRMLQLMVAVPGSVSQRDLDQALVQAVIHGRGDCIRILRDSGADFSQRDNLGNSLVKRATESGQIDVLDGLLDAGCSVNACNSAGIAPIHFAARSGQWEVVSKLLSVGADKDGEDPEGNTPLILAAMNCHRTCKVMKILAGSKCKLNAQNRAMKTALHYTARYAIGAEMLLEAGADPNIRDSHGNTPMMTAATEGFDNIVSCLLKYRANPDLNNDFGKAPIHFLAMKNHWKGIEAIAAHHGNVDLLDNDNKSPLWYAISRNRPEAVKGLLRANCNTDLEESTNLSHLKLALDNKLYGIAKLLVLSGCKLGPLLDWLRAVEGARNSRPDRHFLFVADDVEDSEDKEEMEAVGWFQDWTHRPHTLRHICRICIRRVMGSRVTTGGQELPLPPSIRDYVVFKEVDDHHVEGHLM